MYQIILISLLYFPINFLFKKYKIPRPITYIIIGITCGKPFLNIIDNQLYGDDFIKYLFSLTLIITLMKGMLSIDLDKVNKNKKEVIKLSLIPVAIETTLICLVVGFAFWNNNFLIALLLGFIISPVSPAIVVPSLSSLIERGIGKVSGMPSIQLLAASLDDIVGVILFYVVLIFGFDVKINLLLLIPTITVIPITLIYKSIKKEVSIESMSVGWARNFLAALMFVMLGALIEINEIDGKTILIAVALLVITLSARFIGVMISLPNRPMNLKKFSFIANLPKATVQATLGPLPLVYSISSYDVDILNLSVIMILITAPIGSILIETKSNKYLNEK